MKREISEIVTEIYNDLHRQATAKRAIESAVVEAKYEGYEQALCDFTRFMDVELEREAFE